MMTIPFEALARGIVAGALAGALSVWFQTGMAVPTENRLGHRLGAWMGVDPEEAHGRADGDIQIQRLFVVADERHG